MTSHQATSLALSYVPHVQVPHEDRPLYWPFKFRGCEVSAVQVQLQVAPRWVSCWLAEEIVGAMTIFGVIHASPEQMLPQESQSYDESSVELDVRVLRVAWQISEIQIQQPFWQNQLIAWQTVLRST